MRASFKAAAAALIALVAAGCFYSERELIGFWRADRGLPPGEYTHAPFSVEGVEWGGYTWRGEIRYSGRRYVSDAENFPHQGTRLRRLSGETYLAQLPRDDGVGYGVMFLYPRMATYHMPDCHRLPDPVLDEKGVSLDEEGFCHIDDLDQLETVMRAYLDELDGDVRIDGIYRRVR